MSLNKPVIEENAKSRILYLQLQDWLREAIDSKKLAADGDDALALPEFANEGDADLKW